MHRFLGVPGRVALTASFVAIGFVVCLAGRPDQSAPAGGTAATAEIGNAACAGCHREIADRYARTAMARTSGPAGGQIVQGSFVHPRSGVAFEVRDGGTPALAYSRPGAPEVRGVLPLDYYVGSNTRGRTFLFSIDGFLYQSPVNYYARRGVWDMSPGYQSLTEMELNHQVDSSCLFCHASRTRRAVEGTANRFDGPPFLQPGVGCERCHGPGAAHAAGRGPIVNPARLDAERRDAVCQQCHLEGAARIAKAGRSLLDYHPGDRLRDYVSTFVLRGVADRPLGAVSQVEALAASRCKRASGDSMWCVTCHDPHGEPGGEARVEHYRSRCLGCHSPLTATHHPDVRDCTSCHMPRRDSADIAHTAVTDHRIPKIPQAGAAAPGAPERLVEFGTTDPDSRELGLAYAELGARAGGDGARDAARLLERAARERPDDAPVLAQLGSIEQQRGHLEAAEQGYRRALAAEPSSGVASANLGVVAAARGDLEGAIALWAPAYERNPQLSALGMNLASAQCAAGRVGDARATLARLLRHDPDRGHARAMAAALRESPPRCLGPAGPTL